MGTHFGPQNFPNAMAYYDPLGHHRLNQTTILKFTKKLS
jgi:hypothetical protein